MGGFIPKDKYADKVNWGHRQDLGCRAITTLVKNSDSLSYNESNHRGRYLSWNPGGAVTGVAKKLGPSERWQIQFEPQSSLVTIGISSGFFGRYLRVIIPETASDLAEIDVNGRNYYHGTIFWRIIINSDHTLSFKSVDGRYLSSDHGLIVARPADASTIGPEDKFIIVPAL